jgi:hypothetical protein
LSSTSRGKSRMNGRVHTVFSTSEDKAHGRGLLWMVGEVLGEVKSPVFWPRKEEMLMKQFWGALNGLRVLSRSSGLIVAVSSWWRPSWRCPSGPPYLSRDIYPTSAVRNFPSQVFRKIISIFRSSFLSSVVLFNAAFLCYKQILADSVRNYQVFGSSLCI